MIKSPNYKQLQGLVEYLKFVPYDVSRSQLYSPQELYAGYDPERPESFETCFDTKVYKHFIAHGKRANTPVESMARTLHDHGIHIAMDKFFDQHDARLCVGVMGGHAQLRTSPTFRQVANISKRLTELGFVMISGGGPGAMEATHLGAWMAGRTEAELDDALQILAVAPAFTDERWLASAMCVQQKYPQHQFVSLGIPTWLYGHEPSTPFATHIAKFFENSVREDSILTLAFGGIIFTPGSAGTLQEIFQEAVQNHYLSFGFPSPMIFFGKQFWTDEIPIYPLLEHLVATGKYKNLLLSLTDDTQDIIDRLLNYRNSNKTL